MRMKELRYTLLSDGSSDRALFPLLTWLLQKHLVECAIQTAWADLGRLPNPPKKLKNKIKRSVELYPCEVLFVHRDAERESRQKRVNEIREATEELGEFLTMPIVCVVPIRMQEAWLLFHEAALRKASGNPNGQKPLQLPDIASLESLPDPKATLHKLLCDASELEGRRLQKFQVSTSARRVGDFIDDFSPLYTLPAFKALEAEIAELICTQGWCCHQRIGD